MSSIEERVAVIERVLVDHAQDLRDLALLPQGVALLKQEVTALREDFAEMRAEKQSSKATTAALVVAAISAFATLGAAALTLLGTAP